MQQQKQNPSIKRPKNHAEGSVQSVLPRKMDRWAGKVAIVTGASAGIGAATSKSLVHHGVKVVGLARRLDKLQELVAKLGKDKFYPVECDVRKEEDILRAFKWTEEKLGGADILVNNVGVSDVSSIIDTPTEKYYEVINVNLIAPAICSREFAQRNRKRKTHGHIININSVAGYFAEAIHIPIGMYAVSKYGLRALTTELRHEIIKSELNIKVTSVSPGPVVTDLMINATGVSREVLEMLPMLKEGDIADAVISALQTPQGVEIHEIIVMPQNQAIGSTASKLPVKK